MKTNFILVLLVACSLGCAKQKTKEELKRSIEFSALKSIEIPQSTIEKSELEYNNKTSQWLYKGKKFSGYAVSYYQDSSLIHKIGMVDGKKQNQELSWYPDGHLKRSANYHLGKLEGAKKTWNQDSNHILIAHLNYHLGKLHGEQKKWYATGELFKRLQFEKGKENGMQQAFRKNGKLFANYEAREGRIFGLKSASLCFGIEDENIKYEK